MKRIEEKSPPNIMCRTAVNNKQALATNNKQQLQLAVATTPLAW